MKKITALLLCVCVLLSLAACGKEAPATATTEPMPTANDIYVEPEDVDTEPSVYYLNHDPAMEPVWQQLAQEYEQATGTHVYVITAAQRAYTETLLAELDRKEPVTLFYAQGIHSLEGLEDRCLDLSTTAAFAALADPELALRSGDAVVGLPGHTESIGLLVDTALLEQAGYTLEQVLTPQGLADAVDSITENAQELGFQAFAVPGLDTTDTGAARQLACYAAALESLEGGKISAGFLATHVDCLRTVWDLASSGFGGDPAELMNQGEDAMRDAFSAGEAVFCFGGSRDAALREDLALIPIPSGEESLLITGSESFWCVNAQASSMDVEATLAFLDWVLTEKADVLGMSLPYGEGHLDPLTTQALSRDARQLPLCLWAVTDEQMLRDFCSALTVYACEPTDDNWALVTESFRS